MDFCKNLSRPASLHKGQIDKSAPLVESTLQDQNGPMRVEPCKLSERLVSGDTPAKKLPLSRQAEKTRKQLENQPRDLPEEPLVVLEMRPKDLRYREEEMAMGKFQEQFLGQVLCVEAGSFLVAQRAKVERLARKQPEVGIFAGRALHPSDTPGPVSASEKLVHPCQDVCRRRGIAFVADTGFTEDRLHDGLPVWAVDGHVLAKRNCMAFHFNETVNLTQNAPRIEDEGPKAESGPPNR